MLSRHRRSRGRNHIFDARLMTANHIQIALNNHRHIAFSNRFLGLMQTKNMPRFIKQQRLWRVQIFWRARIVTNNSARKSHDFAIAVTQHHHHSPTKQIATKPIRQASVRQFLPRKSSFFQCFRQRVAILRRIANQKITNCLTI